MQEVILKIKKRKNTYVKNNNILQTNTNNNEYKEETVPHTQLSSEITSKYIICICITSK